MLERESSFTSKIISDVLYKKLAEHCINIVDACIEEMIKTEDKIQKIISKEKNMTRTEEIVANKQLRKEIDEKIQQVKALPTSEERSLAIIKLKEAVMWLGMDLKRLNDINPYPSSKDPNTGDKIEPTADELKL